jgi:hypothetical protein
MYKKRSGIRGYKLEETMKIKTGILIIVCAALAACGGAIGGTGAGSSPKVGDSVVFKTSPVVYGEGKVEKVEGGKYEIRSGNNIQKADANDVYPMPKGKSEIQPGDIVVAFQRETYWSAGEVKAVNGDVIEVEPVSGSKINAAPDKVVKVSATAVADIKGEIAKKGFEEAGKSKKPVLPKDWKPKKDEKVAAQWSFGSWHVAIIKNVNANNVDIDWQNGWSDSSVALDKIAPYPTGSGEPPAQGSYVIVKPQSDTQEWKFATVASVSGSEAEVKLADGKTQKVRNTDFITLY